MEEEKNFIQAEDETEDMERVAGPPPRPLKSAKQLRESSEIKREVIEHSAEDYLTLRVDFSTQRLELSAPRQALEHGPAMANLVSWSEYILMNWLKRELLTKKSKQRPKSQSDFYS